MMDSTHTYFDKTAEMVLKECMSNLTGLKNAEVTKRQKKYGLNELPEKKRSLILLFLQQFNDIMVYILFVALGVSIAMPFLEHGGELHFESFVDAIVIAAILLLNAALGFFQEYKAEEAIAMLQKLSAPTVRVRRNGKEVIIDSKELVPGDILIIEAGDKISADARVLNESHLVVNESSLTGESATVDKTHEPLENADNPPLGDQRNMVFSGTLVTSGYAECVVIATGVHSQIGKIASLVSSTTFPETPLQQRMAGLGKLLGAVVLALCVLVFAVGMFEEMPFIEMLLIAVSLAVSAVPEGLPAVVTVCMGMGVRRMAKQHAIVRRLEALETLGSVTVICADKTGTITENKMKVTEVWLNSETYSEKHLGEIVATCNRASLPNIGDPTEIALLEYAKKQKSTRLNIEEEQVPFSSENKYMQVRSGNKVYLKGAPEKIFALSVDETDAILKKNSELASKGLRVLGVAEKVDDDIRFVGLVAMQDPPRPSVKKAIKEAEAAGIRTIMITGDNEETALAIAKSIGLKGKAMHASELDQLTDEQSLLITNDVSVFARVSPSHKLKILSALQENGEIVSMSGDGVNDAPALKGAHVGVAMGKIGTEVAREASSIVLADDDYATIVLAIKEGRRIYDNIRKFVLFLLRANFDELLLITTALLLKMPLPYLPVHILWINLMTDGLPALSLGMEPAEKGIMTRNPRDPKEHLLAGQASRLLFAAVFAFGVTFVFYLWQLSIGLPIAEARTTTLTLAVIFELYLAHSARSEEPLWRVGLFSNSWLIVGTMIPIAFHIVLITTPIRNFFHLTAISGFQVLEATMIATICFIIFEMLKLLPREKSRYSLTS